ncbi:anti-sigma factor family protein [Congregibacter sp.]|uniref:anti-sigma factor family protein n=1 Tax=Congregibacter sp. TaxID=2744308 RepID=UPI003F6CC850
MKGNGMDKGLSEQDIELLSQYLDGELAPALSRALEARLHSEVELQAGLVRMQELNQRMRDALAERDQIPEAVEALLKEDKSSNAFESNTGSATVLNFPGRTDTATVAARPVWMYAVAASFVGAVALSLVSNITGQGEQNRLPGNDSFVTAALDNVPSGDGWAALQDGREIQPVLSFPHEDGRWCREYLLRGGESDWRAVACREEGRWVTQAAGLESYLEPADAYRPAGAADSAPVASFISQHAGGIALGREAEAAMISSDWQQ